MTAPWHLRPAGLRDLEALIELENAGFTGDRLSRRSFRRFLQNEHDLLLIAETDGHLAGYSLLLCRQGTSLCRLYSLAVSPQYRGRGLGEVLLRATEQAALERHCSHLRLEVRPDNHAAIRLYRQLGYRQFQLLHDYYEDHADALRFEKRLLYPKHARLPPVPFYAQTTEFTCGPACLMMAMKALNSRQELNRRLELQLWREATTIFMTSGHGGCSPHGLALAAHRRGFEVRLHVSSLGVPFIDGVRDEGKKEVIHLVHEDFLAQLQQEQIAIHDEGLNSSMLEQLLVQGWIPLILISSYRISRSKAPHWVVLSGADDHFFYIHDPDIEWEKDKSSTDNVHVPILRKDFLRMAQFGRQQLQAMVLVRKAMVAADKGFEQD